MSEMLQGASWRLGSCAINSVMNFNEQLKTEEGCYTVVLKMPVFIVYTWKELNLPCCIYNHLKACRNSGLCVGS